MVVHLEGMGVAVVGVGVVGVAVVEVVGVSVVVPTLLCCPVSSSSPLLS